MIMKKLLIISLLLTSTILLGCQKNITSVYKSWEYTWSDYKWNYIWWWAMNLAWNDLNDNILHSKLQLKTQDQIVQDYVRKFNNPAISKEDLDEASYYIKSGYWQATIDAINRESKAKFPNKSFGDLQIQLKPLDIISYAYFFKQVEYKDVFEEDNLDFSWTEVKWFQASNNEQRNNIKILKYENDDKFIIKINLKNNDDELILAKWYNMANPKETIKEINSNNWTWLSSIWENDIFRAPIINLDCSRKYNNLVWNYLNNKWFEAYRIEEMFENIKFKMNKVGAKVENEAWIHVLSLSAEPEPKIERKLFILDKPYWIIMKKSNSENPYFILGVNNTELMEKVN